MLWGRTGPGEVGTVAELGSPGCSVTWVEGGVVSATLSAGAGPSGPGWSSEGAWQPHNIYILIQVRVGGW